MTCAFFRSMHGRLFLLLMLGVVVSASFTIVLAHHQQEELLVYTHAQHRAERVAALVGELDGADPASREQVLASLHGMGIHGQLSAEPIPEAGGEAMLERALHQELGRARKLHAAQPEPCHPPGMGERPMWREGPLPAPICQQVLIALADGTPVQLRLVSPPRPPIPTHPPWDALLLFAACIAALAWLVARIATRPLQHLADAADALDLSNTHQPLTEHGSSEMRSAIRAFNRMQQRIGDDLRERTGMLAAITHDLQTPLTRLRLRLEKVSDETLREKLVSDMSAMQQMLQEGLELARSLDASEPPQRLDLDSLLDSVCSDAQEVGQPVEYLQRCRAEVEARPLALRRAIANLLDNAVKYGLRAEMALVCDQRHCAILIRDHGPGIPAQELEAVFTPFYRLEQSRSRETGGTGLGLSITRNIVLSHSGQITLRNHPLGGLEAEIVLPLAESALRH
ncbi:MAG: HAMP domain-containing protein [Nitrosomonadales bacterium]|nr:HAMP domain-containing protein [Nitrosomonadales bacterium]